MRILLAAAIVVGAMAFATETRAGLDGRFVVYVDSDGSFGRF